MKKNKNMYILVLAIICFWGMFIRPTYAKFSSNYTTDSDVVGLDFNFDVGISNIEEYQEIKISANNHRAFNVEITNNYDDSIYYGIWYKMIVPKEKDDSIKVARVNSTEVPTFGSIEKWGKVTASLVIINNSDEDIKVAIGVGSSVEGTSNIEYLGGKYLITEYSNIPINVNASSYIKDLYNDEENVKSVNIGDNKDNPKLFLNTNQKILLDNNGEYRYYGIDTNNYVSFNDELWRIVSVSKVYDNSAMKNGSDRVKIIRDTPIGFYSWNDKVDVNEWSISSINNLLNDLYFNGKSSKCIDESDFVCNFTEIGLTDDAKKLIDKALFYLGGVDGSKIDSINPSMLYNAERGNGVYSCADESDGCPRSTSYLGYVGLLYASDYLYSANNFVSFSSNINSWLKLSFNNYNQEYTITPVSNSGDSVISINDNFNNLTNKYYDSDSSKWNSGSVRIREIIRPVVYLRDDVVIVDGLGTKDSPYTLKLIN